MNNLRVKNKQTVKCAESQRNLVAIAVNKNKTFNFPNKSNKRWLTLE